MQSQVVLVLIFVTGIVLLIASITDWDYVFGIKKEKSEDEDDNILDPQLPFLTRILNGIFKILFLPFKSKAFKEKKFEINEERNRKRVFYAVLGIIIIILGIYALNSGKFS